MRTIDTRVGAEQKCAAIPDTRNPPLNAEISASPLIDRQAVRPLRLKARILNLLERSETVGRDSIAGLWPLADGFIAAGRGYAGQRDVPAWTALDAWRRARFGATRARRPRSAGV